MYTVQFIASTALAGVVYTLFDPEHKPLLSTDQGYTRSTLEYHRDALNRARWSALVAAAAA